MLTPKKKEFFFESETDKKGRERQCQKYFYTFFAEEIRSVFLLFVGGGRRRGVEEFEGK